MIECKELNQSFETKEELFKALKDNKEIIFTIKKKVQTGYDVLNPSESKQVISSTQAIIKKALTDANKDLFKDDDYYYIIVNSTNILDSHGDLHVKGIWNKSAKEQSGKNFLVDTHQLTIKSTIAYPDDVEIFVTEIPFKSIGYNYKGNAEVLVYKVRKDKIIGEDVAKAMREGKPIQASVRMQYVKMDIALNSDDKEDKAEKKNFEDYKDQIANIADFKDEPLYFFIIKEAKNVHESSLVPFGSNHATRVLQNKHIEPLQDTQIKADEAADSHSSTLEATNKKKLLI
jgi:hypothetical protein